MLLLFIVVLPMQYTANFKAVKIDNVQMEICDLFFAQNIDSGYTLNLPKGGCSNEYQNPCLKKENICRSLPRSYLLTYKTKAQISCTVCAQLIRAFVCAKTNFI